MKKIVFLIFCLMAIERIIFTLCTKEQKGEQRYQYLSYLLISSYIFSVVIVLFEFYLAPEIAFKTTILGLVLIICGIALRRSSVKDLGDFWSWRIKYMQGQQVVQRGAYRYVRHPYYIAVMVELVGLALFLNSYIALCYIFIAHLTLLILRAFLEEKFLLEKLGETYRLYQKKTGMFLPKDIIRNG